MATIRRFSRQVAERFSPDKIILFGSHAYGTPHADSDVDILVIMPTRNQLDQAARIGLAIDPPFPLDIQVRTPHTIGWRLAEGVAYEGLGSLADAFLIRGADLAHQVKFSRGAKHGTGFCVAQGKGGLVHFYEQAAKNAKANRYAGSDSRCSMSEA